MPLAQNACINVPKRALGKGVAHLAEIGHDFGPLLGREAQVAEGGNEDVLVGLGAPFHDLPRSRHGRRCLDVDDGLEVEQRWV